jgi:hypothetical protein
LIKSLNALCFQRDESRLDFKEVFDVFLFVAPDFKKIQPADSGFISVLSGHGNKSLSVGGRLLLLKLPFNVSESFSVSS